MIDSQQMPPCNRRLKDLTMAIKVLKKELESFQKKIKKLEKLCQESMD